MQAFRVQDEDNECVVDLCRPWLLCPYFCRGCSYHLCKRLNQRDLRMGAPPRLRSLFAVELWSLARASKLVAASPTSDLLGGSERLDETH